ncbi:hypothetical protein BC829DRAFT_381833 [Chytridium lagenaria]|nr:hypothetical protein BC829DRAFT_381833 [Chytridium lagenaria]
MAVAAGVALRFDRPLREGRVSAHPETIAALRLALSQAVGVVIAMMVGADDVDAFDMDIRTPFANHESGRQRVSSTSSTASNDPIPTHASVSALRDRLERQRRTGVAVTLAFDLVDRPVAGVVLEASVCASVGRGRIGEGGRAALEVVAGELRDRLEWHRRVVEVGGGGLKVSKDEGMGIVAVDCGIAVVRDL